VKFFNGQVGTQHQNIQTLKTFDCPILNKKLKKKEDSLEVGTDYEHQRAKDYLTQELKQLLNNNKNY
jgi:flagellar biogenesis protein FliO